MADTPENRGAAGNTFEARYGAFLLTHLLSQARLPALRGTLTKVSFQAKPQAVVDDFFIEGINERHESVTACVAARRNPALNVSASSKLFATFVEFYCDNRSKIQDTETWIVLAAERNSRDAKWLRDITNQARHQDTEADFEDNILKQQWGKEFVANWDRFKLVVEDAYQKSSTKDSVKYSNPPSFHELAKSIVVDLRDWDEPSDDKSNAERLIKLYLQAHPKTSLTWADLVNRVVDYAKYGGTASKSSLEQQLRRAGVASRQPKTTKVRMVASNPAPPSSSLLVQSLELDGDTPEEQADRESIIAQVKEFQDWVIQQHKYEGEVLGAFIKKAAFEDSGHLSMYAWDLDAALDTHARNFYYNGQVNNLVNADVLDRDDEEQLLSAAPRFRKAMCLLRQVFDAQGDEKLAMKVLRDRKWNLILD